MKELQNQGLQQVEGWRPKRAGASTSSDVSPKKHEQESLLKSKELRTNPQDSIPQEVKQKLKLKSVSEVEGYWKLRERPQEMEGTEMNFSPKTLT